MPTGETDQSAGAAARSAVNLQQAVERDLRELSASIESWLSEHLGRACSVTSVARSSSGGSANETILVGLEHDPEFSALVFRLSVPDLQVYFDNDLVRQAAVLDWVGHNTDVPVPTLLAVEPDASILGGPFMAMERMRGEAAPDYPGYNVEGFLADATVAQRRATWGHAMDTLARLHVDAAGQDTSLLAAAGLPADRRALVGHWRRALEWMGSRVDIETFLPVFDWLDAAAPHDAPDGLSWGDARVANMLFADGRCTCVLDWEMASLGGPLVDLAWWLMFDQIQSDDLGVERLPGLPDRQDTIDRWARATSLDPTSLPWFEVLAHLELALTRANVFAQRAVRGLPVPDDDDPRAVGRLMRRIDRQLEKGVR